MLALAVLVLSLSWAPPAPSENRPLTNSEDGAESALELNTRLGQGVNILGADPLWTSPSSARFRERHFEVIKAAGFDSVRINLHPFRDGAMEPGNNLAEGWLHTLDWAVGEALRSRLLVVLDLHESDPMGSDPTTNRTRFLSLWSQLAEHYRSFPDTVLFELLNEPGGRLTPAMWNVYLREALTLIRRTNPTRVVVVGPARANSIRGLGQLNLPANDPNVIVTIHYYSPFAFTHQGAAWVGRQDDVGVHWSGTPSEKQAVQDDFEVAARWARAHDRPVYLGEFGAYEVGDLKSRTLWTAFVAREAERHGWSWSYWQFDGDFVVYDIPADAWVLPILESLNRKTYVATANPGGVWAG